MYRFPGVEISLAFNWIQSSNEIIHQIDRSPLPPTDKTNLIRNHQKHTEHITKHQTEEPISERV